MDSNTVNSWLTLGANIAVLAGIFVLAFEISQNTEMMQAEINQSRAELSMFEAEAMYNSEYIPAILTKLRRGDSISDVEAERYVHLLRGLHRNWDNQLRQHREGLLAGNIPRSIRQAVETEIVSIDAARDHWEQKKQAFSEEYIIFVDLILAENPRKP